MGRERTWTGKPICFCAAGLILFLLSSCMTSKKEFTSSSKPEVYPVKVEKQEEAANPADEGLRKAKKLFDLGDYGGSLQENQKVLSLPGKNSPKDQALFNMGLIYASVENPRRDVGKAIPFFKRILVDYPRSPLAVEARVWTGVLEENKKLSQAIEKSKQVDIAVEEKKREKAR
jgi:tetratricopeptide (TPR) repeat protein